MITEIYLNRTLSQAGWTGHGGRVGHPTSRWWAHPQILCGGSINPGPVDVSFTDYDMETFPDERRRQQRLLVVI